MLRIQFGFEFDLDGLIVVEVHQFDLLFTLREQMQVGHEYMSDFLGRPLVGDRVDGEVKRIDLSLNTVHMALHRFFDGFEYPRVTLVLMETAEKHVQSRRHADYLYFLGMARSKQQELNAVCPPQQVITLVIGSLQAGLERGFEVEALP